jgi:hypothetical protein
MLIGLSLKWGGPPGPRGTPPSRSLLQAASKATGASADPEGTPQGVRPTPGRGLVGYAA